MRAQETQSLVGPHKTGQQERKKALKLEPWIHKRGLSFPSLFCRWFLPDIHFHAVSRKQKGHVQQQTPSRYTESLYTLVLAIPAIGHV